jgi:hypothetical protein
MLQELAWLSRYSLHYKKEVLWYIFIGALGTLVSLIGSILGTLLVFYLVFQAAYLMITPVAVEAFLLLWTLPVFLLADWTGRY